MYSLFPLFPHPSFFFFGCWFRMRFGDFLGEKYSLGEAFSFRFRLSLLLVKI